MYHLIYWHCFADFHDGYLENLRFLMFDLFPSEKVFFSAAAKIARTFKSHVL